MNKSVSNGVARRRRLERLLGLAAIVLIAAAWILGSARAEANLMPAVQSVMPEAGHFARKSKDLYLAYRDASEKELLGYVALGQADGYGGPLTLAIGVSLEGEIVSSAVADHKETPAWMNKVTQSDLLRSLAGKTHTQPFALGDDLDGVTGATYTARAVAKAALAGSQAAAQELGLPVAPASAPQIQFGLPEITILALFVVGYIGQRRGFPYTKQARWGVLLAGLLVLGFIYSSPLTIAYITKMLLGYWPQWQSSLYFYFLIGGIVFFLLGQNKNLYCDWICPFGAAQECFAKVGGARHRSAGKFKEGLKWAQRVLALAAIVLSVYFRSPGLGSFELFGAMFKFVGSSLQFAALGIVILASLYLLKPWCNYLCPLRPVFDFIRMMREWVKEIWQKTFKKQRTTPTTTASASGSS